MASDFPGAFAALRDVLKKHGAGLIVQTDTPTNFTLITPAIGPNKKPMWFGCVMLAKSAVSYHLVPLYCNPALQNCVPEPLRARKQGKTCFNFQRPDAELFAMLDALTGQARAQWQRHGFLEPGQVSQERLNAALQVAGEDPEALAKLRKAKGKAASAKRRATIKRKAAKATRRSLA